MAQTLGTFLFTSSHMLMVFLPAPCLLYRVGFNLVRLVFGTIVMFYCLSEAALAQLETLASLYNLEPQSLFILGPLHRSVLVHYVLRHLTLPSGVGLVFRVMVSA